MNPEELQEIMRLMESSSFDELVLETKGFKLTLRRGEAGVERVADAPQGAPRAAAPQNPVKAMKKSAAPAAAPEGCVDVTAPFLGVFYAAPKPGAAPFVKVGDVVDEQSVVGIIEVMKLMNSVHAGAGGEVTEIFAVNGAPVEYGQPLLRVRTIP
jgi:acetyl-CoA carboxylase biotin carboxyl carrier protein